MTDHASPIPGWRNAEDQPVTYGDVSQQVDEGATVLVDHVTALAAAWSEEHDATALLEGVVALVRTLTGYSLPLIAALVKADEVQAYIEAQAAAFVVPDTIDEEV